MAGDPLEYLFSLEHFGIKFGLENIRAILAALGNPERAYPSIHIAGTNGKGSVTALVDAILRAAGYRSGRYTSPHLIDLSERFAVNGVPASPDQLRSAAERFRDAVLALQAGGALPVHPTFFEATTAVAFDIFRRAAVDVAVCEVGLGGRLDATNVLVPRVTAITSIGLDHEQYLGTTLAAVAAEKAGIIKPEVPVVVGVVGPEARTVIARIAGEQRAPMIDAGDGVSIESHQINDDGTQTMRLRTPSKDYGRVTLGLAGAHQVSNATVAVRLVEVLDEQGFRVPADAVVRGLADVQWPGRLQTITLEDGREALLDAAHNPAGAEMLAAFLAPQPRRPMVFGVMRDKDAEGILRVLAPVVSAMIITSALTPRAAEPERVAAVARRVRPDLDVRVEASLSAALGAAWNLDRRILVAGSIFLLGDVLNIIGAGVPRVQNRGAAAS